MTNYNIIIPIPDTYTCKDCGITKLSSERWFIDCRINKEGPQCVICEEKERNLNISH